jgi:hypothetical protein
MMNTILNSDFLMLIWKISQMQGFESSVLIIVKFSAESLVFDDIFFRKIIKRRKIVGRKDPRSYFGFFLPNTIQILNS